MIANSDHADLRSIARALQLAAVVLLVAWSTAVLFSRIGTSLTSIDFDVFWKTARLPSGEVYGSSVPYPYPPPALLWLQPLRLPSFEAGYVLWVASSALLFAKAVSRLGGVNVALLSLFSIPAFSTLNLGQTSMLLAALIIFGASLGSVGLGIALGIVATFKPQLVIMAPLILLVRRDWAALAAAAVAGLAMCIIATLAFGVQSWVEWVNYLPTWQRNSVAATGVQVLTPKGYAEAHGFPGWPFLIAGLACCLILIFTVARRLQGLNLVALIVGTSIMSVPYAVHHDAIGIMPALAAYVLARPSWKAAAPAALLAGLYQGPVLAVMGGWLFLRSFWNKDIEFGGQDAAVMRSGAPEAPVRS